MYCEHVIYGSDRYEETLKLRDKVMREPLGLSITNDDLSYEEHAMIIAVMDEDCMQGVGIMSVNEETAMIHFICVDTQTQKSGIGTMILKELERLAASYKVKEIGLEARVSAKDFYKRNNYIEEGEEYEMEVAPVPHILMKKAIEYSIA